MKFLDYIESELIISEKNDIERCVSEKPNKEVNWNLMNILVFFLPSLSIL